MNQIDWSHIVFNLLGGLGIFLFGIKTMSSGMQQLAGNRIKRTFDKLTNNRFVGLLVGLSVTALIQSSSATTVMIVGFINAGLMELSSAVGSHTRREHRNNHNFMDNSDKDNALRDAYSRHRRDDRLFSRRINA